MHQQAKGNANGQAAQGGRTFRGSALRHVAMPLGGIGTGQVSLCGDGGLRQWEIFNQANHLAFVPDSFFAISVSGETDHGAKDDARILQSRQVLNLPEAHTPLVDDDAIPDSQRALVEAYGGVAATTFTGAYPFARISYLDDDLPIDIDLEAYSPFVPLDQDASSLPAILFTFRLRNGSPFAIRGALGSTLKNVVGWDGVAPLNGNHCSLFGGNTNRLASSGRYTALVMENPSLTEHHPGQGQLVLSTPGPGVQPAVRWQAVDEFMRGIGAVALAAGQNPSTMPTVGRAPDRAAGYPDSIPSKPGETWNGGLCVPFILDPGASTEITFTLSWYFPNRYVNFEQATRSAQAEFQKSRLWLGNAYTTRFRSALDALDYITENRNRLEHATRAWSDALLSSTLPPWLAEFVAAQGALIRSPTTFQSDDGRFYGFEGARGASTAASPMRPRHGGSCPLNCTHVWNYEQAISRLFPELERTMRETDFDFAQAPEGYIPHRTIVPLFVRQLWGEPIGDAPKPALDGMLGTILKLYREVRQGASREWLDRYWPRAKRLLDYIQRTWDADGDGVLIGEQPNTYDIAFYGRDMFIGGLWLAALRAAEELARLQDELTFATELHNRFVQARDRYDALLWNGEYYVQLLDEDDPRDQQYLTGCLADQLLGQWWAHQLDLGYILPKDHVQQTLRSIVRFNFRRDFLGKDGEGRVFADGHDQGLELISWPHGGQPDRPTRYHDEVWTGIEYQVAAHCIMEGLDGEGMCLLRAARERYSGVKRNPYNDIECGDHYARAMSGWSVIEAVSGYRYSAFSDTLAFAPNTAADFADDDGTIRMPFITASGWGVYEQSKDAGPTLKARHGEVRIGTLTVPESRAAGQQVIVNGTPVKASAIRAKGSVAWSFREAIVLRPNQELAIGV